MGGGLTPLHIHAYTEGKYVKACSCILKDGRVVICVPVVKRTAIDWRKSKVRHRPNKRQVIIDFDLLLGVVKEHYKWLLKMKRKMKQKGEK